MGAIYEFLRTFLIPVQQAEKKPRGARSGHLGLVMAKLAEINFNLESNRVHMAKDTTGWKESFIVALIAPNWTDRMTCMCNSPVFSSVANSVCFLTLGSILRQLNT